LRRKRAEADIAVVFLGVYYQPARLHKTRLKIKWSGINEYFNKQSGKENLPFSEEVH